MASPMKSSPLKRLPRKAPKMLPRATSRWSMAKPVTSESFAMPASSPRVTGSFLLVHEGQSFRHVGLAALVGSHAEHRCDPADGARYDGRHVPAGRREAVGILGCLRFVEHDDDHIARVVHREHTGETRDVDGLAIPAIDQLLGRTGLAADPVTGRVGL